MPTDATDATAGAAQTALAQAFAVPGRIEFVAAPLSPLIDLSVGEATARVSLHGAHLTSWRPAGAGDVIWVSPESQLAAGKALRGGVPICWPWFGAAPSGRGPAHGFVRTAPWEVAATRATATESAVGLRFSTTDETRRLWPHDAEAILWVTLTATTLGLALSTRNTGERPFVLGGALHTYFAVGDIGATLICGLDGCRYLDKVGVEAERRQSGDVGFTGEVDRVYLDPPGAIEIDDAAGARIIRVESQGSRSAVVWNPWVEKSARLGDMGPERYRRMVCVETANAASDVITLAPGGTHLLVARYGVRAKA